MPCQVWTTGFFDKNVVGTANALAGGLGNLGGGVTYFVMPAVYKGLVRGGLPSHQAWRVAFVVPGVMIVGVALCLVVLCEDTPTGKWSERHAVVEASVMRHGDAKREGEVVDIKGDLQDVPKPSPISSRLGSTADIEKCCSAPPNEQEKNPGWKDTEAQQNDTQICTSPLPTIQTHPLTTTRQRPHNRNHPHPLLHQHPHHHALPPNPRTSSLLLQHLRRRTQH